MRVRIPPSLLIKEFKYLEILQKYQQELIQKFRIPSCIIVDWVNILRMKREYDKELWLGIQDELRVKLGHFDIDEYMPGVLRIQLQRSNQYVTVSLDENTLVISHTKLPDGACIEAVIHDISTPDLDPIREICKFVDMAAKLCAYYAQRVGMSEKILDYYNGNKRKPKLYLVQTR